MQPSDDRARADTHAELWRLVAPCFESNDGSLPDILIEGLKAREVAAIYGLIRRLSRLPIGQECRMWSNRLGSEVRIDSVPNAAEHVIAGDAEPFHHCVEDLSVGGVTIPTLGVFVVPDAVNLDYRMGPDWDGPKALALFRLLGWVRTLAPDVRIGPSDLVPAAERFRQALDSYAVPSPDWPAGA